MGGIGEVSSEPSSPLSGSYTVASRYVLKIGPVPPILDNSGLCRLLNVDGVAVSDGRTIGADGRCREAVGSTVDVKTATFTNSIGEASLSAQWMDPAFDPAEAAFYYVRVIEIPKPRWTTHDAAFFDIPLPESVAPTVQDRAYTSPIWYTQ